jgi:hypothetical protein
VQVDVRLPRVVAAPQPAEDARIEPDDRALDVLARVADVEAGAAVDQIGQESERFRLLAERSPTTAGGRWALDARPRVGRSGTTPAIAA